MTDSEIDETLERAARARHPPSAELLKRISDSIEPTLTPVRPLMPQRVLAGGLFVLVAAVAVLAASRSGFAGFLALPNIARASVFGALVFLGWLASARAAHEWVPGSPSRLTSIGLLAVISLGMLAVFGLQFDDYRTTDFVSAGLGCLTAWLLCALPAGLLAVWWLRRGWVGNAVSAGVATGTLAGLAGVALLELQCTNFQALHILVWHVLVLPTSAAVAAVLAWLLRGYALRVDH